MIMIILLILNIDYPYSNIVNMVIMYIALALTIISLLDYISTVSYTHLDVYKRQTGG